MLTATLEADARRVVIAFPSGEEARFPALWLRENCASAFHPDTRERTLDLLSVAEDVMPLTASIDGDRVVLDWGDHISRFDADWLLANRPGTPLFDPAETGRTPWPADLRADHLPRGDATTLSSDDAALLGWLEQTRRYGLGLVTGLHDDSEAGMRIGARIGFKRETNFGVTFDVISKPNPNNLAYTADALPLHTDLTNQEMPPGFQFLHCVENSSQGGGSVFADGFQIAEDFAEHAPEHFALLRDVRIPMRFHDDGTDIRTRDTVIRCDGDGTLQEIRYNAHLAAPFDMPLAVQEAYYPAYRAFMAATREPRYHVTLRLGPGEMVVFDNRRILHGRQSFDPSTGHRFLRGFYVDRGDWDSRMRILATPEPHR